jgi:hypothetical protein
MFAGGSLCLSFTALTTTQHLINSVGFFLTTFSFAGVWRHYLDFQCGPFNDTEKDPLIVCGLDEKDKFFLGICIVLIAFFSASEVQRMRGNLLRLEHEALCSHYTSVREADASCEEDKWSILAEIGDKVPEVDNCINILSIVGMSTHGLRYAIERGANITSVADIRFPWIGLAIWMLGVAATMVSYANASIAEKWGNFAVMTIFAASLCCPLAFVIVWFLAEVDKRAFIKASASKLMIIAPLFFAAAIWPWQFLSAWGEPIWYTFRFFPFVHTVFGLMAIVCAALGMGGVAAIPYVGPCLAGALGPGWRCPLAERIRNRGVTDFP